MSAIRRGRAVARARSTDPFSRRGQYRLVADAARRVSLGHPWVFREALGGRSVSEPSGSLVELQGSSRGQAGSNQQFVARGFVDQEHTIIVRVLTRDQNEAVHPGAGTIAGR